MAKSKVPKSSLSRKNYLGKMRLPFPVSFLQPQTFLFFLYNQLKPPSESLLNRFLMSLYFNVLIVLNIYQEPVLMAGPPLGVLKQKSEYKRARVYQALGASPGPSIHFPRPGVTL